MRDRIIQQALLQILHPLIEPQFSDSSFAYRPGRSHLQAVATVQHWGQRGYEMFHGTGGNARTAQTGGKTNKPP